MQELVAGMEKIRFGSKAGVEELGAQPLPFPGLDSDCGDRDCPFPPLGATASVPGCPWYDRGFCKHGPRCKYKHTRRVMCANYLVGFCPEGPKCRFVHLKAGLTASSTDPPKEAGRPWGPLQRDLAAAEAGGGEDVPPKEPPPRGTQHLAAHPWDIGGCPPSPRRLLEGGTCSKSTSVGPCGAENRRPLLGK